MTSRESSSGTTTINVSAVVTTPSIVWTFNCCTVPDTGARISETCWRWLFLSSSNVNKFTLSVACFSLSKISFLNNCVTNSCSSLANKTSFSTCIKLALYTSSSLIASWYLFSSSKTVCFAIACSLYKALKSSNRTCSVLIRPSYFFIRAK